MIAVLVTLEAHPGQGEALSELVSALAGRSREEPGCLRWDWYRAVDVPEKFILCEVFRDEAAFSAHKETEHVAVWKAGSAALVAHKESSRFRPGN